MTAAHQQPPEEMVERIRSICASLPGACEHDAWTGTSWRVRGQTFAHIVEITDGWPPAYSRAFETHGPATIVTFQADTDDYRSLAEIGHPFHRPPWRPGIVGHVIGEHTDWDELTELITDSHHLLDG